MYTAKGDRSVIESYIEVFNRSPWLAVVTTLLAVAGILVSIYFGIKSTKSKKLRYGFFITQIIGKLSKRTDITASFKGKPIEQLSESRLFYWNPSRFTIDKNDIDTKSGIQIVSSKDVEILEVSVLSQTKDDLQAKVDRLDEHRWSIKYDYPIESDGFVLNILHTGFHMRQIDLASSNKGHF